MAVSASSLELKHRFDNFRLARAQGALDRGPIVLQRKFCSHDPSQAIPLRNQKLQRLPESGGLAGVATFHHELLVPNRRPVDISWDARHADQNNRAPAARKPQGIVNSPF